MHYDVIIIGAGPGGIFTAYEMLQQKKESYLGKTGHFCLQFIMERSQDRN